MQNRRPRSVKRGDVYFVEPIDVNGTRIQKFRRPAVVVSNDFCNHYSDTIEIVYMTANTHKTDLPTHVFIKAPFLNFYSIALCEHVHSVDKSQIISYMGHLNERTMEQIDRALVISLHLENIIERMSNDGK
jgi:mRNA interferase MazF